jgi:hypothetical protein
MTLFFKSRTLARAFTSKNGKVVDMGADAPAGRRWAFRLNGKV